MNAVSKALRLSPGEWEILEHRLSVSDAIAEVLSCEELPTGQFYHFDDVFQVSESLSRGLLKDALDHSIAITHAVLRDAVEGSVWMGVISDEHGEKSAKAAAAWRLMQSLSAKVAEYIGVPAEEMSVPSC